MSGPTLIDLARRHPRLAGAIVVFVVALMSSESPWIGLGLAAAWLALGKRDWSSLFSIAPSSYIDRTTGPTALDGRPVDERYETMPRYAEVDFAPPAPGQAAPIDMIDAEEDDGWTPPPSGQQAAQFGIAIPKRKPVDVPRRR